MIAPDVCFELVPIKGHCKMCNFITQHNVSDISNFEGECSWHAGCKRVCNSCYPWIECFTSISHLHSCFGELGSLFNEPYTWLCVTTSAQDLESSHPNPSCDLRIVPRRTRHTFGVTVRCSKPSPDPQQTNSLSLPFSGSHQHAKARTPSWHKRSVLLWFMLL